jgi:hypothetical protein
VVSASIGRLEAASMLNVLAEAAFDEALAVAKEIDEGSRRVGPLLGKVPSLYATRVPHLPTASCPVA